MRKFNLWLLTIACAFILLVLEIIIIRRASGHEPLVNVVCAAKDIVAGETFTEDMLNEKSINISFAHNHSIKNKNELIGKIAKTDLEKDEIILASRVTTFENFDGIRVIDKNSRLVTIEFRGDQVNGWQLKEGQYVDIIFIPDNKYIEESTKSAMCLVNNGIGSQCNNNNEHKWSIISGYTGNGVQRIKNVRIAALIDEKGKLVRNNGNESIPKYISFEVDDLLDEFLVCAKGSGKIEVSVIPSNGND